jgi:Herpesvirus dUTPase protein
MEKTSWTGVLTFSLTCMLAVAPAIMLMTACSSPSTPSSGGSQTQSAAAPAKKEPVLYTGKACFSQMTGMAARWQPDAVPFHMESALNAESSGHDGKATIWRGMFASPNRRTYKVFTCSGSRLREEAPIGITSGAEVAYGPTVPALLFQAFLLNTDSDQAYALAQEKGGAKLMEKNPQQPVLYTLDWNPKDKALLWVVFYGSSTSDSKGIGVIDATTGKFLRAAK